MLIKPEFKVYCTLTHVTTPLPPEKKIRHALYEQNGPTADLSVHLCGVSPTWQFINGILSFFFVVLAQRSCWLQIYYFTANNNLLVNDKTLSVISKQFVCVRERKWKQEKLMMLFEATSVFLLYKIRFHQMEDLFARKQNWIISLSSLPYCLLCFKIFSLSHFFFIINFCFLLSAHNINVDCIICLQSEIIFRSEKKEIC